MNSESEFDLSILLFKMGPKTGPTYILIQKVGKQKKRENKKSINCKIKLSKEISVILS